MSNELPRPGTGADIPGWELELASALGYSIEATDTRDPEVWNLPLHPFAFLEDSNEVITWEVDGPEDDRGMRTAHIDPSRPNEIALRAVRRPLPSGFEFATITTTDGVTHRIALRKAAE